MRKRRFDLLMLLILALALSSACSGLPFSGGKAAGSSGDNPVIFDVGVFVKSVTLVVSYVWLVCGVFILLLTVLVLVVLFAASGRKRS